jgi:hypothetical protein
VAPRAYTVAERGCGVAKRRWVIFLALLLVMVWSADSLAKNWDYLPPLDQIQPGDTLYKGDAKSKTVSFPGKGQRPNGEVGIQGSYFDGLVYGCTDIWFEYCDPLGFNSGPRGYGVTMSYESGGSSLVEAYAKLYERPLGYPNWFLIDSCLRTGYNTNTSGEAWVQCLTYNITAPMYVGFLGTTQHRVHGSGAWSRTFSTSDSF